MHFFAIFRVMLPHISLLVVLAPFVIFVKISLFFYNFVI